MKAQMDGWGGMYLVVEHDGGGPRKYQLSTTLA